jgi:hypothetical protein
LVPGAAAEAGVLVFGMLRVFPVMLKLPVLVKLATWVGDDPPAMSKIARLKSSDVGVTSVATAWILAPISMFPDAV